MDNDYITYFLNKKGFSRFILGLKEKYESLGRFTGSVKISNLTPLEVETFEKFFGETFEVGSTIKISLKKFEKVIAKSKFDNFDYFLLVNNYLNISQISTKKEKKKARQTAYLDYLEEIFQTLKNYDFKEILSQKIASQNSLSRHIKNMYYKNASLLKSNLQKIDLLFASFPKKATTLPIYASLTGNPHFLDFNTINSNLFFRLLACHFEEKYPTTNDERVKLLEKINVYTDTLSNFVITSNLTGDKLLDLSCTYGPLNLNVDNINYLNNGIGGLNNEIYIFENPSLLNHFKNKNISIIITSGIPNYAFYKLLEKIDPKITLFYNGDFDPEGLLIASKLQKLYPNLKLFCYEAIDYYTTKPGELLSNNRLKKLDNVNIATLRNMKKLLLEEKKAGYQEHNLTRIEEYINKN